MEVTSTRRTLVLAGICLGLVCSGCSFVFSQGRSASPDQLPSHTSQSRCSKSFGPPIADTLLASTHLISAAVGSQLPDTVYGPTNGAYGSSKGNRETVRAVVVGVDLGFAALFAASAIYGYVAVSSCLPKTHEEPVEQPSSPEDPRKMAPFYQ